MNATRRRAFASAIVLGLVLSMSLLVTIGAILLIVGLILNLVPLGGARRRVY